MNRIRALIHRHRSDLAVGCALLLICNVLAVLWVWRAPRIFLARGEVFVATSSEDLSTSYLRGYYSLTRVQSYAALATSPQVLARVSAEVAPSLTVEELDKRVTATVVPQTVVLQIAVEDTSSSRARDLADAVGAAVVQQGNRLEREGSQGSDQVRLTKLPGVDVTPQPVSPRAGSAFLLAELIGLVLVLLGTAALRLGRERIGSRQQVSNSTGLSILMNLTYMPTGVLLDRGSSDQPRALGNIIEQLKVLRTQLGFVLENSDRLVAVVSPGSNDGRTFVALGLAQAMARDTSSVLLVDGDLRNAGLSKLAGLNGYPGLSDAVTGPPHLVWDACVKTDKPHLVGAGQPPPSPTDLLTSRALDRVLNEFRETYEMVVVDTSDLCDAADAALWARRADATILVARNGVTSSEDLRAAAETLRLAGAKLAGVVLTGA